MELVRCEMRHLIDDAAKLGRAVQGLLRMFSVKGRLFRAVRVARPNWPEGSCCKATNALSNQRVKGPQQFSTKVDYLAYLDMQLTRYAAENPLIEPFPVADELGLKRWEQRWQASRQHADTATPRSNDAARGRAA